MDEDHRGDAGLRLKYRLTRDSSQAIRNIDDTFFSFYEVVSQSKLPEPRQQEILDHFDREVLPIVAKVNAGQVSLWMDEYPRKRLPETIDELLKTLRDGRDKLLALNTAQSRRTIERAFGAALKVADALKMAENPLISELNIKGPVQRAFRRLEIETLNDAAKHTANELLGSGIGRKGLRAVRKLLAEKGRTLSGGDEYLEKFCDALMGHMPSGWNSVAEIANHVPEKIMTNAPDLGKAIARLVKDGFLERHYLKRPVYYRLTSRGFNVREEIRQEVAEDASPARSLLSQQQVRKKRSASPTQQ